MNSDEAISLLKARFGEDWKGESNDETGWSLWTFYRIEKGKEPSPERVRAILHLKPKSKRREIR